MPDFSRVYDAILNGQRGAVPGLVRRALGAPGVVAGAFAYRSDSPGVLGWLLTTGGRLRCRGEVRGTLYRAGRGL